MKTRLPVLLLLILLLTIPACSSNDKGKLNGRWESMNTTQKCVLVFDHAGFGTPRVTISLSGNDANQSQLQPVCSGTYTLLAGDFIEIELDAAWNGLKKHREKITVTGSQLTLRDGDGTTIVFQLTSRY